MTNSHPTGTSERPEILPLTSLRGLAALLIVVNHLALLLPQIGHSSARPAFVKTGLLGMTVFFVLSGFVMYYNYAHRIASSPSAGTVRFIFARIARLYPLLIVYVLFNFGLNIARSIATGDAASASTFMTTLPLYLIGVQTWFYAVINGINVSVSQYYGNPAWSISAELFFYLVFVPVIILRGKSGPSVARGVMVVIASVACRTLFIAIASMPAVQSWIGGKFGVSPTLSVDYWLIYYSPYGRCFEFFAGLGLAEIWLARNAPVPSLVRRLGMLTGLAGIAYIVVSFGSESVFHAPRLFEDNATNIGYVAAVPPAIFFLSRSEAFASRVLTFAPLLFIGEISYSLYLVHTNVEPVFHVSPETVLSDHVGMAIARCVLFIGVSLLIATASYRFVEMPARLQVLRFLRKFHPD
ncbi:acyltransferase [Paraburkholderia sp. BL21I4N1]|uniref:acyltransferase family protein n=1 Tax=Paraburkholderia sp. BL21I4N1 TaxID=1938801 RepID=UPI000CFDCACC|nr:acyltransferase [Paraburkholderia sp. BL21I4N1]PQV53259.1 peptidoglycan/LPS O-acetylase OafA/YrhL [Paraburkholderia sp. BL21I4N1]